MPPKAARSRFRAAKRRQSADGSSNASGVEMHEFFRQALTLQPSPSTFDMDSKLEKVELAVACWANSSMLDETSMTECNGALASVLEVLLRKCCMFDEDMTAAEMRTAFRLEGLITNMQRAQSQKQMPIITARVSVAAARCQLHGKMWRMMSLLSPGLIASHGWTDEFIKLARNHRPPCEYEELPLVGGTMFDNYTRKVLYKSQVTVESHGLHSCCI